jgi:tetratricopeptide (TPR) repeat protein
MIALAEVWIEISRIFALTGLPESDTLCVEHRPMRSATKLCGCSRRYLFRCLIGVVAGLLVRNPLLSAQRPEQAAALAQAGWQAFEQGRLSEAKQSLDQAVHLAPAVADYQAALAEVDSKSGEKAEAIRHFQRAIQLKPLDAEFRLNLAEILQTENNDLGALRVLQVALPSPDLSSAWHFSRGFSLFRTGRFGPAIEEFTSVLQNPLFRASASFFLGNIAYSQGEFDKAEPYLAMAVKLGDVEGNNAYNAYAYDYGLVLFKLEKFAEAETQFKASIAHYRGDPLPWMFLGRCEEQLGNYPAAIQMLETSIKTDPRFQLSYYELARLQQRHGDSQRAAELFKKIGDMKAEEIRGEEDRAMKLRTVTRP